MAYNITESNAKEIRGKAKPRGQAKIASDFRNTVRELLEKNTRKVSQWLDQVAEGDIDKGVMPDPARALDLIVKLAEYAAPKLQRVNVDAEGNALANQTAPVTRIAIQFVDGRAPSAIDLAPVLEAPALARPEDMARHLPPIPAIKTEAPQRFKREKQRQ